MSNREPVDTGDVKIAEIQGDIKAILARIEGVAALVSAQVDGVRSQIESVNDRFSGVENSINDVAKMAKRALAQQSEHSKEMMQEIRDIERKSNELEAKLQERLRALEARPKIDGFGLTRSQKTAIIAIIGAIASALGFGGGTLASSTKEPPQQEQKP